MYVEIQITCGTEHEATVIGDALVEQHLAACVHIWPIRSVYRWDGAVRHDGEVLIVARTRRDRYEDVQQLVLAQHSYDVPAITAVEMIAGSPTYLAWLDAETRATAD